MQLIKKINQHSRVYLIKGKPIKLSKGKYEAGFDFAIAEYISETYNCTIRLAYRLIHKWIKANDQVRQGIYNK